MRLLAKERLTSAMELLLQKKGLDEISVSEIVDVAGVCRKTFYRNFTDKYALASHYFEQFLDQTFGTIVSGENFETALLQYLDICQSRCRIFKNAYSSADINGLRNIDINYTRKIYQSFLLNRGVDIHTPEIRFAIEIAARGGADMVIDWVMHDMPMEKETLCDLIKRTLPNDLLRYL